MAVVLIQQSAALGWEATCFHVGRSNPRSTDGACVAVCGWPCLPVCQPACLPINSYKSCRSTTTQLNRLVLMAVCYYYYCCYYYYYYYY